MPKFKVGDILGCDTPGNLIKIIGLDSKKYLIEVVEWSPSGINVGHTASFLIESMDQLGHWRKLSKLEQALR